MRLSKGTGLRAGIDPGSRRRPPFVLPYKGISFQRSFPAHPRRILGGWAGKDPVPERAVGNY